MNGDEPAGTPLSLRERRWAVAGREIPTAAESKVAENGPATLSLRAVARSLGATVQALYHRFPSRDGLITALVAKAHGDLADAGQDAVDTVPEDCDPPGWCSPPGVLPVGGDRPDKKTFVVGVEAATPSMHRQRAESTGPVPYGGLAWWSER
ncbi:TetR/AcrR family transcriptional regulator [Streptomyces sp. AD55]|uniref:TetR/AcrR family transcriptional regulator n=1 Tax=Streptomyces sp. AD55 TaxID=3242895 RepID=UPI0035296675